MTLTLTFELQGHVTIELSNPDNLGVGKVFRLLGPLEILKGHCDLHSRSNMTLTLTFELQGHVTIELSNPDNLGVGKVFRLPRSQEIYASHMT